MKTKLKNFFKKIYDFFTEDIKYTRGLSLVKCLCVFLIGLYIGASTIISFVGIDYIQEKMEQVETKLEVVDKHVNYANSVNDNVISPTGTISIVYFNTSLTAEEVNAIIDSVLGVVPSGTQKASLVCCDGVLNEDGDTFTNSISVVKMNTGTDNAYVISVYDNNSSVDCYMYMTAYGFNGWLDSSSGILNNNPYTFTNPFTSVASVVTPDTQETIQVGQFNNLLTNLISPVPFLFEGTNTQDMESSGINTTTIEDFYINTTLTNVAMKEILDSNLGTTNGTTFNISVPFMDSTNTEYYNNYRVNIINTSTSAFIRLENTDGSLVDYWYIYDTLDTSDIVYWYGISPDLIDNNGHIFNSGSLDNSINISYDGTLETALNFLFSDTKDFTIKEITPPTYEQGYEDGYYEGSIVGYQDGYNQGKTDGINVGVQQVIDNPSEYNLYDSEYVNSQYESGFNNGRANGVTIGREQVINNPNEYDLYTEEQYQQALNGTSQNFLNPVFTWLNQASGILSNVFSVQIFPGVTLGLLICVPLVIALLFFILKLFFGG